MHFSCKKHFHKRHQAEIWNKTSNFWYQELKKQGWKINVILVRKRKKNDTAEIPHHLSKVIKNIWVSSNSELHWIPKSIISWDLKKKRGLTYFGKPGHSYDCCWSILVIRFNQILIQLWIPKIMRTNVKIYTSWTCTDVLLQWNSMLSRLPYKSL